MVCAQAKNNNPFSVLGVSRKHVSKRFRRELNRQSTDDPAGAQLDETLLRSDTRSMFSCDETFVSLDRWFVSFKFIREFVRFVRSSINFARFTRQVIVGWWSFDQYFGEREECTSKKGINNEIFAITWKIFLNVILFSWITIRIGTNEDYCCYYV